MSGNRPLHWLLAACVALLVGCFDSTDEDERDAGRRDGTVDQQVTETTPRDGPRTEGPMADTTPRDGPGTEGLVADRGGPEQGTDGPAPDAPTCPASKSVWDTMKWDEGCVWQ